MKVLEMKKGKKYAGKDVKGKMTKKRKSKVIYLTKLKTRQRDERANRTPEYDQEVKIPCFLQSRKQRKKYEMRQRAERANRIPEYDQEVKIPEFLLSRKQRRNRKRDIKK